MNIEEQARREAEERYPAARVMHFSGDGPVLDVGAVRLKREAYAAALISERSKAQPLTVEQVMSVVGPLCIGDATERAIRDRLTTMLNTSVGMAEV